MARERENRLKYTLLPATRMCSVAPSHRQPHTLKSVFEWQKPGRHGLLGSWFNHYMMVLDWNKIKTNISHLIHVHKSKMLLS